MRLSDAIAMGRTLVTLEPFKWLSGDSRCGCAIGMGLVAVEGQHNPRRFTASERMLELWPWLNNKFEYNGMRYHASTIISDMALIVSNGHMTLDQLIDWVRSVEPAEPEQLSVDQNFCDETEAKVRA